KEAQEELYAQSVETLVPLRDKAFTLAPVGEVKVGDQPAIGVRVSRKDHRDISLFFDKDKGLLLKSERIVKDEMAGGKEVLQESVYSNYKYTDAGLAAMKITIKRDGKPYVDSETKEVKLDEKLDDAVFGKP